MKLHHLSVIPAGWTRAVELVALSPLTYPVLNRTNRAVYVGLMEPEAT
jgi:hypothetical protein